MSSPDEEKKPAEWSIPVAFHFMVKIQKTAISFSEVKGIDFAMDVQPMRSGGDSFTSYYLPKGKTYSDLILSRGILKTGDDFFTWCNETLSSPPKKDYIKLKNILVSLLDEAHNPIKTWIFKQAYPVKWSLSDFNAMKNEVVVESIHFKYNSIYIDQN